MDIDEAGHQGLARRLDGIRLQSLWIRCRPGINFCDLAVLHQYCAAIDYRAVAHKKPRVPDQQGVAAAQVPRQHLALDYIVLCVRLPDTHQEKRSHHRQKPQLGRGAHFFFFLPAKQLDAEEGSHHRGEHQHPRGGQVVEDCLAPPQNAL